MSPRQLTQLSTTNTRAAHDLDVNPPFIFTGSGGSTRASVVPNESFALLVDGDIRTSAGPAQTANIT